MQWRTGEKPSSETHGKKIKSPARPETSSQHHGIAQHELDRGSAALPVTHRWAWSRDGNKHPRRSPRSWLLPGSTVLAPLSQTAPASNPSKTPSETSNARREPMVVTEKHIALKLDSVSTSNLLQLFTSTANSVS